MSYGGNYIVTASNPEGPWSEPYYIEGADGIDPSLFFDEDGKCYYIGTHPNPEGCKYDGDWYIWIQELDVKTMKLVGEHKNVWNGAMKISYGRKVLICIKKASITISCTQKAVQDLIMR